MRGEREVREYLSLLKEEFKVAEKVCTPERKPIRLRQLRDMIRATEWILGERSS